MSWQPQFSFLPRFFPKKVAGSGSARRNGISFLQFSFWWSFFQKAPEVARRASSPSKNGIFFSPSLFFWACCVKRKGVKRGSPRGQCRRSLGLNRTRSPEGGGILSVILSGAKRSRSGVEVLRCEAKRNTVKPKHNGAPLCEEIYKRLRIPDLHKLLFLVHDRKRM